MKKADSGSNGASATGRARRPQLNGTPKANGRSRKIKGDARKIKGVSHGTIDLIITSPPYWRGRDYGHPDQLGFESTPEAYVKALIETVESWRPLLRPHASVFINIADSYSGGYLAGTTALFEVAARKHGWKVANHIIWAKESGVPEPKPYRLARRHESIFHLTLGRHYYFDLFALSAALGQSSNPGNVWRFHRARSRTSHIAPFPPDLARNVILLACPERVCTACGKPFTRLLESTATLDERRPQARRALARYESSRLTEEHLAAVRAVGISDSGKGRKLQSGASRNSERVKKLAKEAKRVLGGYFREFTFAIKQHAGWQKCKCKAKAVPGTVLDPFMGSGTTLRVAESLGFNSVGIDLTIYDDPPS